MKQIKCDVIQDLLPSYCDKISSKETNMLVEEHLQSCSNCMKKYKSINKDLNIVNNQQEEIDFLKEYRKRKTMSIIFAITIVLIIANVIIILLNTVIPNNFTGREHSFDEIDSVNAEYMYWTNSDKNTLALYLYSNKYKELNAYVNQIYHHETNENEIWLYITAKRELRPFIGEHTYASGLEKIIDVTNVDKISISSNGAATKEIWNKYTKVPSKEEWAKWYVDSYMPKEAKDKYPGLNYNTLMYRVWSGTGMWRHLYEPNINK